MAEVKEKIEGKALLEHALYSAPELSDFWQFMINRCSKELQLFTDNLIVRILNLWSTYVYPQTDCKALLEELENILKQLPYFSVLSGKHSILESCKQRLEQKITPVTARNILLALTWSSLALYDFQQTIQKFNDKQLSLLRYTLRDIVEISNSDLLFKLLKALGMSLRLHPYNLLSYLEKINKLRYYAISLCLFVFGFELDAEEPEAVVSIRNVLRDKLYREGVYNRSALRALDALSELDIKPEFKSLLIAECHQALYQQKDKRVHLDTWDMLRTLAVCELESSIEKFIEGKNGKRFSFRELHWQLFSETFKLSAEQQVVYDIRFKHRSHHLLLGYYQKMMVDNRPIFENFIKAVLNEGEAGYHSLRYDNPENPHLCRMFEAVSGSYLQTIWRNQSNIVTINGGELDGFTIHNTDEYWTFLTWGMEFNCLEPLEGKVYLLAHLLDGQNRLLVIFDKQQRPVAGTLMHLLFRGEHDMVPILVLSPIYVHDLHHTKLNAMRSATDHIASQVAQKMGLPLYAFTGGKYSDRTGVKLLEKSEAIFSLPGYIKKGRNGTDELSSPTNRRNDNEKGIIFYHDYHELYVPSLEDMKAVVEAKHVAECRTSELLSSIKIGPENCSIVMGYLFDKVSVARDSCPINDTSEKNPPSNSTKRTVFT